MLEGSIIHVNNVVEEWVGEKKNKTETQMLSGDEWKVKIKGANRKDTEADNRTAY